MSRAQTPSSIIDATVAACGRARVTFVTFVTFLKFIVQGVLGGLLFVLVLPLYVMSFLSDTDNPRRPPSDVVEGAKALIGSADSG